MSAASPIQALKAFGRNVFLFSAAFLLAGVAIYVFSTAPERRALARSRHSVEILRPLFSQDKRFTNIHAGYSTAGGIIITGDVRTAADLDSLKALVEGTSPPPNPLILVNISPNLK